VGGLAPLLLLVTHTNGGRSMKLRLAIGTALLSTSMLLVATADQASKSNLNDASLEIATVQALHDLELTPAQLTNLAKFAQESAPKEEGRKAPKTSAEFATALT